jgi:hydroxymethylpyrimidine kinase/phosphomethylpyrimidine kinase
MAIGGFDPSGGAGILADIKTIAAMNCYGVAVVTSITQQNTVGVFGAYHQTADSIGRQMEVLFDDFEVIAIKTGMLPSPEIVRAVSSQLRNRSGLSIVVDPVLRSSTAFDLAADSLQAIVTELFPLASLVTPNIAEAEIAAGIRVKDRGSMVSAASRILELGAAAVLVKGGDLESEDAVDVLLDRNGVVEISGPRIISTSTHGTGCTLASAIASLLARGLGLEPAVRTAKSYLAEAIRTAPGLGKGFGPLNHFPKCLS